MGKITEAFGAELDKEMLEGFMRQEAVALKFSSFCRGESAGRLFVFFQPDVSDGEVRALLFNALNIANGILRL